MSHRKPTYDPIFILGIMPRSGTNFLHNLVLLHPDCELAHPGEDFFLAHSDLLVSYADRVYNRWDPKWRTEIDQLLGSNTLCMHLGNGLISYLQLLLTKKKSANSPNASSHCESNDKHISRRFATVTPNVNNLEFFFKIFPRAHLLILVRDGRAVVESGVRSFGWDYEKAMRRWADASKTILGFDRQMKNSKHKYLIVRYEDLYADTKTEMTKILTFLGLDPNKYNFERAVNMSVSGSSELKSTSSDIHWKLFDKPPDFDPLSRWQFWSRSKHERFNWIAGNYIEQFGYTKQEYKRYQFIWSAWNIILDNMHELELKLQWRRIVLCKTLAMLKTFMFVELGSLLDRKLK